MVNRKRKVLLLTTLIFVFTIATVASIFSSQTRSYSGSASGETNLYSITLTKDKATSYSSKANSTYSSHYDNTLNFKTARGNGMTVSVSNSTTSINSSSNLGNLYAESALTVSSEYATAGKSFQKINSITISSASTADRTARLYFNGADSYSSIVVPNRSSATFDATSLDFNVRSFILKGSSSSEYSTIAVTSIVINYSCSSDYSEDAVLSSIAVDASGAKTQYTVGESFSSEGVVVTATYSDLSHAVVLPTSISSPDMTTTGEKNVTVSYTENEVTKTCIYLITVSAAPAGLSGTYSSLYASMTFTDATHGYFVYSTSTCYFTYSLSGSNITFVYESGDKGTGMYYLFTGGNDPVPNDTGKLVSDTQITVYTYNEAGSTSQKRILNK